MASLLLHPAPLARPAWLALLVAGVTLAGLAPAADGDLWWHLAAGREMVARAALLHTDPFSVSAAGREWPDVHWLFQLVLYGAHLTFGLAGLVWLKCLVIALGAGLLWRALARDRFAAWAQPLFVTLSCAALVVARQLLLVRPVFVTLLCLAFFFLQLERYRSEPRASRLISLLAVQVIWANFQGLSALGPAMVAAYALAALSDRLVGERRWFPFARERMTSARDTWRLLGAAAGCTVASALTPFGSAAFLLPAKLLGRLIPSQHNVYSHTVAENVPPFVLERWSGELWHLKWYFAFLALALVAGRRRVRPSHALLLVGFATLALLGNRNVLLFYWVATPIISLQLAPAVARWGRALSRRRGAVWLTAVNGAVLAAVLAVAATASAREGTLAEPSAFRSPAGSVRVLAALPGRADVFTADHHGGYLIWQLFPRYRPYIDTRLVLRTPDEFADYLSLADDPQRFDAFQREKGFGYVVLPVSFPDRYLGLIAHLYRSRAWRLIYTDGTEVLFARRDLAARLPQVELGDSRTIERVVRELERAHADQPRVLAAARLQLATLTIAVGEPQQALLVLAGISTPESSELEARARLVAGDGAAAFRALSSRVLQEPEDPGSLALLARLALQKGELRRGAAFVERALRADPFDAEASRLLTLLEESEP